MAQLARRSNKWMQKTHQTGRTTQRQNDTMWSLLNRYWASKSTPMRHRIGSCVRFADCDNTGHILHLSAASCVATNRSSPCAEGRWVSPSWSSCHCRFSSLPSVRICRLVVRYVSPWQPPTTNSKKPAIQGPPRRSGSWSCQSVSSQLRAGMFALTVITIVVKRCSLGYWLTMLFTHWQILHTVFITVEVFLRIQTPWWNGGVQ